MRTLKKVVVIGGGITGLSTVHYLQKLKRDRDLNIELMLVEKNEYLGGKIHTVKNDEYKVETGADSIVARHESVMPLVNDLQLEDELVYNATGISYIHTDGELHPIPLDTVFGIPTSEESLFSSTLVSEEGKKAALKDYETKNESFTLDSSIGEFLEAFLGKELVERQIAPVLSGVYSGKLEELTIASTLPYLLEFKNKYGSIIKGLNDNKHLFLSKKGKFISFKSGLSAIIDRLEDELTDCKILKGIETTDVKKENDGYVVSFANHEDIQADFVVLSTPHQVTQALLKNEELDEDFNKLSNASLISIYLGFTIPDEELPADGTGFIVTEGSGLTCNASTWTSRKWEHTSANHHLLVRLFYKSSIPEFESMKRMNEEELLQVALSDIENSLKLKAKPTYVEVTPWNEAMPNYHMNHNLAVKALSEKMLTSFPNVHLAGCSYYGVGIGACIKNGKETAERIVEELK